MKEFYTNLEFIFRYSKFKKLLIISLKNNRNSVKNYINNIRIKLKDLRRIRFKINN